MQIRISKPGFTSLQSYRQQYKHTLYSVCVCVFSQAKVGYYYESLKIKERRRLGRKKSLRALHTLHRKQKEEEEREGELAPRRRLFFLPYVGFYIQGSGYNIQMGGWRVSQKSSSRPLVFRISTEASLCRISARSVLFVTFSRLSGVPFFFVSVYVCPAVSHSTPGKNNKPRDTIQILDVISLLSGSKREKDRGKCVHIIYNYIQQSFFQQGLVKYVYTLPTNRIRGYGSVLFVCVCL